MEVKILLSWVTSIKMSLIVSPKCKQICINYQQSSVIFTLSDWKPEIKSLHNFKSVVLCHTVRLLLPATAANNQYNAAENDLAIKATPGLHQNNSLKIPAKVKLPRRQPPFYFHIQVFHCTQPHTSAFRFLRNNDVHMKNVKAVSHTDILTAWPLLTTVQQQAHKYWIRNMKTPSWKAADPLIVHLLTLAFFFQNVSFTSINGFAIFILFTETTW